MMEGGLVVVAAGAAFSGVGGGEPPGAFDALTTRQFARMQRADGAERDEEEAEQEIAVAQHAVAQAHGRGRASRDRSVVLTWPVPLFVQMIAPFGVRFGSLWHGPMHPEVTIGSSMKIGELGRLTRTRVETIRFYEAEGLIPAPRRSGGNYRIYEETHLGRLSFIRRSRDLGFTLDQVRTLLRLADDRGGPCAEVDAITAANIGEIDRKIADLKALRAELVGRLDCCEGPTISDCRIIEALAPALPAEGAC